MVSVATNSRITDRTVLIVEDDPLFRKVLTTVLSSLGVRPLVVASGEAALEAAKAEHVDMVLMDYHLPGINGLDLARTLRARDISSPMILISGFLTDEMKAEAQEVRIAKVIHKPMDMSVLQNCVVGLLEKSDIRAGTDPM